MNLLSDYQDENHPPLTLRIKTKILKSRIVIEGNREARKKNYVKKKDSKQKKKKIKKKLTEIKRMYQIISM